MSKSLARFFIIGAGRAGTTSLCEWLGTLPGVVLSEPKEPNFFCRDEVFAKGLPWYESLAPSRSDTVAVGEGSVLYSHRSYCPSTAARIRAAYPEARLVYVTRNPLTQVLSSWRYTYLTFHGSQSFSQALRDDESYLERCDYAWQLEPYVETFGAAQVHVAFFEDFVRSPAEFLEELCTFLSVRVPHPHPLPGKLNASEMALRPPRMLERLRKHPSFLSARRYLPASLRRMASRSLSGQAPLPADHGWSPETHRWFVERVQDRTLAFLRSRGKPREYWDLSLPTAELAS